MILSIQQYSFNVACLVNNLIMMLNHSIVGLLWKEMGDVDRIWTSYKYFECLDIGPGYSNIQCSTSNINLT